MFGFLAVGTIKESLQPDKLIVAKADALRKSRLVNFNLFTFNICRIQLQPLPLIPADHVNMRRSFLIIIALGAGLL